MTRRAGMWWSLLAVLAACVATLWFRLGSTGLSMSEGHRAVPAWEMLRTGEWWVTRMFGEIYVRKPPGMMWAIAGVSAVFGETAWSARAVSALACTAMALAAWWFARR
jgi:4-amino-4-deoxy-L-arabinose transferase-like glycosyltransferase